MKTTCSHCAGEIEYEQSTAGLETACPHCGKTTRLAAYAAGAGGPPALPSGAPPNAPVSLPANQPKKKSGCVIALIICGILLLFGLVIIGLLAAIAVPNFKKARAQSQRAACVANLKAIDGAKASWALEQRKAGKDVPNDSDLFGLTLYLKEKPTCPAGGFYILNSVEQKPTCSIPDHSF
jgi:competence protein ComGC